MRRSMIAVMALICGGLLWGAPVGASTAAAAGFGGPMVHPAGSGTSSPGLPTISLNWSGYAVTSNKQFNYVHSEFVQPAIVCPGVRNQWTSNWVGLDGFNTGTVEQDGTSAFCGGPNSTTPIYEAWYEMFPAGSVNVFRVHPGDVIDATASYSAGKFTLTISDLSIGKSTTHTGACGSCQRASAEWIVERPALCNNTFTKCFLTALADFRSSTMIGAVARVDGGSAKPITGFTNYSIDMVQPLQRGFISLDGVGPFRPGIDAFTTTWQRAGTIVPITL